MKTSAFMLECLRRRSFWSMRVRWARQVSNWRVALTTFMRATIAAGKWEVKWTKDLLTQEGRQATQAKITRENGRASHGTVTAVTEIEPSSWENADIKLVLTS